MNDLAPGCPVGHIGKKLKCRFFPGPVYITGPVIFIVTSVMLYRAGRRRICNRPVNFFGPSFVGPYRASRLAPAVADMASLYFPPCFVVSLLSFIVSALDFLSQF